MYFKVRNQRRASCFATLMQDESNCDVAHFTTYESNLSCNKSGSQVACVQTPPPTPRKKSGRVTSVNLLRKSCSGIHLHKLLLFLFSLWQLKRSWKTNTTLDSCTTRTQLLFFLRGGGVCTQATRMDMDWKLRKLSQLFQVLMLCLQKSPKKIMLSAFWWDLFHFFITIQEH